jgi:hypothetical protein
MMRCRNMIAQHALLNVWHVQASVFFYLWLSPCYHINVFAIPAVRQHVLLGQLLSMMIITLLLHLHAAAV